MQNSNSLHAYYCFISQKSYLTEVLKESNALQMLMAQGQQMPSSLKSDSILLLHSKILISWAPPQFLANAISFFKLNVKLLTLLLIKIC